MKQVAFKLGLEGETGSILLFDYLCGCFVFRNIINEEEENDNNKDQRVLM